jgi:hypothetical protein
MPGIARAGSVVQDPARGNIIPNPAFEEFLTGLTRFTGLVYA